MLSTRSFVKPVEEGTSPGPYFLALNPTLSMMSGRELVANFSTLNSSIAHLRKRRCCEQFHPRSHYTVGNEIVVYAWTERGCWMITARVCKVSWSSMIDLKHIYVQLQQCLLSYLTRTLI